MSYGKEAYFRLCRKQRKNEAKRQWQKVINLTDLLCANAKQK